MAGYFLFAFLAPRWTGATFPSGWRFRLSNEKFCDVLKGYRAACMYSVLLAPMTSENSKAFFHNNRALRAFKFALLLQLVRVKRRTKEGVKNFLRGITKVAITNLQRLDISDDEYSDASQRTVWIRPEWTFGTLWSAPLQIAADILYTATPIYQNWSQE